MIEIILGYINTTYKVEKIDKMIVPKTPVYIIEALKLKPFIQEYDACKDVFPF